MTTTVENSVRERLEQVESELERLLQLQQQQQQQQAEMEGTDDDAFVCYEDSTAPPAAASSSFSSSAENNNNIKRQIQSYKAKIEFLKLASQARKYMEECTGLVQNVVSINNNNNEPNDDNNNNNNTNNNNNWVVASTKLIDALKAIDDATEIIQNQQQQQQQQQQNLTSTPASASQQQQQQEKEIAVAYQILNSLRHQVRRRRVNLQQKATGVVEGCVVEITSTSITVQSSQQLLSAYQVLENLHQRPPPPRPPSDDDDDADAAAVVVPPALDDVLRRLTRKLYQTVFKPLLVVSSSSGSSSNSFASSSSWWWNVQESSNRQAGMLGVSQAQKRGTVHVIEWERLVTEQKDDDKKTTTASTTPPTPSSKFDTIVAWKNLLDVLQKILTFVQTKILLERESLCRLVGSRLFGRRRRDDDGDDNGLNLEALGLQSTLLGEGDNGVLMAGLVEWLETHCLDGGSIGTVTTSTSTDDLTRILSFQKDLVSITIPFCKEMVLRHLMDRDPPPKLVSFSKNFASKEVVDHRRRTLLNTARVLLTQNDYHNTVVVGTEEPRDGDSSDEFNNKKELEIFELPKCSVSDTANKLIELVRQTMDEAVAVSNAFLPLSSSSSDGEEDAIITSLDILRPTLYRTAREMLGLFRAIIPSSHRREVINVPRTAAVLHNDSVFIANHCLTLGLEYKEKFPAVDEEDSRGKLLKQTCVFVDMVPLFRELADSSMGDMLDLQNRQLVDIVGTRITYFGQSLRSNESLVEWSDAETAIAAGVYHLRHLSQGWKPILAYSVFLRSVGYLIDVLVSLYLKQLTDATSISPSARYFVSALCRKAVVDLSSLLDTPKPGKYIPEWGRFVAVSKFLETNRLSDLEQALSSGVFIELGSQELSRLIQAGFPDSSDRHALLAGLSSSRS